MKTTTYKHLERRTDKRSKHLFIKGTNIRASTIWHDTYIEVMSAAEIAEDRELPVEAIYEALHFCQENWKLIVEESRQEGELLESLNLPKPAEKAS
ncbi:MAG: hypothetical protein FJ319_08645 [SAR202 cluster bacterium]|nr:hypothetical protein [SAR202 cluster bacterium]